MKVVLWLLFLGGSPLFLCQIKQVPAVSDKGMKLFQEEISDDFFFLPFFSPFDLSFCCHSFKASFWEYEVILIVPGTLSFERSYVWHYHKASLTFPGGSQRSVRRGGVGL